MPAVKPVFLCELIVFFGFGEGTWGLFWIETSLSGIQFFSFCFLVDIFSEIRIYFPSFVSDNVKKT